MNLSLSEKLTYSTIRIECEDINGKLSTGTGYFFNFRVNKETGDCIPVLITNKHVIQNAKKGRLIFTKASKDGTPMDTEHYYATFIDFENQWKMHPDNDVDLCVLPIANIFKKTKTANINLAIAPLDMSMLPTDEQLDDLSALEELLMIGYPNGIWDEYNNKPILRRGVTATHPKLDYNNKKEFMIDMACFPGSSGSPIFIFNEGAYTTRTGLTIGSNGRLIFLGTLYAGPQHIVAGEINMVPTSNKPIAISQIPNNLGLVIKHTRIKELEALF